LQENHSVSVFEKNKDIFLEASLNNQFRLHQGLHYARSSKTRFQSRDGFNRFIERYPSFSKSVNNNFYLIPKLNSLIDFETYFTIMFSSGIEIEKVPLDSIPFIDQSKFQGAIKTSERVLLNSKAKEFFLNKLSSNLIFNACISDTQIIKDKILIFGEEFDYLVNATWGGVRFGLDDQFFYEPTVLFFYETTCDFPAITLVDGPLVSIYPTEKNKIFTLSSVTNTPLGNYRNKKDAYNKIKEISDFEINQKRELMENEVIQYVPEFSKIFTCLGPQLSIKTKPIGKEDNRHLTVTKLENIFEINSGKIDNIFQASDFIIGQLSSNE
jgi:hypothetical protein